MKRVELRTAYHWFCESCGADNFTLPQKAELTDEDAELAYRRFNDCDPWMELPTDWRQFEMVHLPDMVTCSHCQESFLTVDEE